MENFSKFIVKITIDGDCLGFKHSLKWWQINDQHLADQCKENCQPKYFITEKNKSIKNVI